MQCARCGTVFQGNYCPRCGASAGPTQSVSGSAPSGSWPCPRCGTMYFGNFCPRCGLPAAAWAFPQARAPSGIRSLLSILWTLAMVAFLIFAATDFAGLALSPGFIVPGIQGIQSGQTANAAVDSNRDWAPNPWSSPAAFSAESAGGNPDGYLRMTLFNSSSRGYWVQSFRIDGSTPFTAAVRLDLEIAGGLTSGWLFVAVDGSNSTLDPSIAVAAVHFAGPTSWTSLGPFYADEKVLDAGVYYLKIGFVANATTGQVDVGLDNVRLAWKTAAGVVLYLPLPFPLRVFVSQDRTFFLAYYLLILAGLFLFAGFYAFRERRELWKAIRAPLDAIGTRLKARSAWIAVAQVWMAATAFQLAVILLLPAIGVEPTSPISIGPRNAWVYLYELANAGVYEELAFRLLLIGVPMALGSAFLRMMDARRAPPGPQGSAGRRIAGAWRYLLGGVVRSDSPKETQVAAWAFLFASSAIFGLAHQPAWGWWKVFPTFVAGLGFGYLFLRHGVGAAILAHFVNDYALALSFEGVGGTGMEAFISLLFVGLAVAGVGFFVWYAIEAWRHLTALVAKFRPPRRAVAVPRPTYAASPTTAYVPPPIPDRPFPPSPPVDPFGGGMPGPPVETSRNPTREAGRIPRDYTPSYVPPPYGFPPVRFQCPSCGWVEARYDAGRFTCTRCGRTA